MSISDRVYPKPEPTHESIGWLELDWLEPDWLELSKHISTHSVHSMIRIAPSELPLGPIRDVHVVRD